MVEVTDEDWDAAQVYADLYSGSECYKPVYHQRIGEAFARHRIAAEQRGKLEGARLALEAAAKVVHDQADADDIRALDPAKIVGEV